MCAVLLVVNLNQIGNAMHVFTYVNLLCFDTDGPTPLDCNLWYDYQLNQLPNLNVYECTEEDYASMTVELDDDDDGEEDGDAMNDDDQKGKGTTTIIVVLVVLFVIGLCIALIWWVKTRRDRDLKKWGGAKAKKVESRNEEDGPMGTTQIEMDQPFSQQDHRKQSKHEPAKSHTGLSTTGGGFDMSPLNVNGPTDVMEPSIGDDDHDSHDDDYASDGNAATGDVLE